MEFNDVLARFKAEDPQALLDALEEVEQASIKAAREAQKARDAYFANVREKEDKVGTRIEELKEQLAGYQAKIDAFKSPLVSATAAGDQRKLDSIKDSMKALEADKVQVSTEIEMLQSAHIRGDEELYNAVIDRVAEHNRLLKIYQSARREVHTLAGEKGEAYRKIANDTLNYLLGGGNAINLEKLNKNFHFEVYAKHAEEQAAKEKAEREAGVRQTTICDGIRRPTIIGGRGPA